MLQITLAHAVLIPPRTALYAILADPVATLHTLVNRIIIRAIHPPTRTARLHSRAEVRPVGCASWINRRFKRAALIFRSSADVRGRKLSSQLNSMERIYASQLAIECDFRSPHNRYAYFPRRRIVGITHLLNIKQSHGDVSRHIAIKSTPYLNHDPPHFLSHSRLQAPSLLVHSAMQSLFPLGQSSRHFSHNWKHRSLQRSKQSFCVPFAHRHEPHDCAPEPRCTP